MDVSLNVGEGVSDFCHLITDVEGTIAAYHPLYRVYLFMHIGNAEVAMSSHSLMSSHIINHNID